MLRYHWKHTAFAIITRINHVSVQLDHISIGDWKDISIAHIIIIFKSEVSTLSHCYHIFPWLWAWDVCYIIFCHLLHIRSGKTDNLFSLLLCSLWWMQIGGYVSFVQYTISLSSFRKIIWRHWTYEMLVRWILSSVWVRLSTFSQLLVVQSITQYVGLCVFSLPTPLVMIEIIYILCLIIIIKSEVWTITHCLGLGHETMVYAVCLAILLWIGIHTSELMVMLITGQRPRIPLQTSTWTWHHGQLIAQ